MDNPEKSSVEKLEDGLKKFWKDYGYSRPIRGIHTEVVIEPKFFMGGQLNPQLADLLVSVYLSQTTKDDLRNGRVTVQKGVLLIKDKSGKLIAEVRNQKMIREFTSRFGA
jgi:hypothetical protein